MFFLKWIGRLGDNSVYHLRKLIYSLLRSLTINGFLAKLPPVVILARVKKGGDAIFIAPTRIFKLRRCHIVDRQQQVRVLRTAHSLVESFYLLTTSLAPEKGWSHNRNENTRGVHFLAHPLLPILPRRN